MTQKAVMSANPCAASALAVEKISRYNHEKCTQAKAMYSGQNLKP
jgi:hypothetical protein